MALLHKPTSITLKNIIKIIFVIILSSKQFMHHYKNEI